MILNISKNIKDIITDNNVLQILYVIYFKQAYYTNTRWLS